MKQIIIRYYNNNINYKYYINNLNQRNRVFIGYQFNGSIFWKNNYFNDKKISIENYYKNNKPIKTRYHL